MGLSIRNAGGLPFLVLEGHFVVRAKQMPDGDTVAFAVSRKYHSLGLAHGSEVSAAAVESLLKKTENYKQVRGGVVHPAFYENTDEGHALVFQQAAQMARKAGKGIWAVDVTTKGFVPTPDRRPGQRRRTGVPEVLPAHCRMESRQARRRRLYPMAKDSEGWQEARHRRREGSDPVVEALRGGRQVEGGCSLRCHQALVQRVASNRVSAGN